MTLKEQHKVRFWAIKEGLIDSAESFTDNITKGEVLEMLYKFAFNFDSGKTISTNNIDKKREKVTI